MQQLTGLLQSRIDEGHGETLFDLGLEDGGESMGFTQQQWETALARVDEAAHSLKADVRTLLTYNTGGEEESGNMNAKDTFCHGKLLIRQTPE